jgi:hypothetical protein
MCYGTSRRLEKKAQPRDKNKALNSKQGPRQCEPVQSNMCVVLSAISRYY